MFTNWVEFLEFVTHSERQLILIGLTTHVGECF